MIDPTCGGVGEGGGAAVEGGEAEDGVAVGVRPEGPQVARRRLEVHQVELEWIVLPFIRVALPCMVALACMVSSH